MNAPVDFVDQVAYCRTCGARLGVHTPVLEGLAPQPEPHDNCPKPDVP